MYANSPPGPAVDETTDTTDVLIADLPEADLYPRLVFAAAPPGDPTVVPSATCRVAL